MREKLGLHCLPAEEGYSSGCQGFSAGEGTRELLPRRIVHSPFQTTTCRDLLGLWRAASHHITLLPASARGSSRTCPPASTRRCLRIPRLLLQQPRGHQELLQQMKAIAPSTPQATRNPVVTEVTIGSPRRPRPQLWGALALASIFLKRLLDSP